MGQQLAFVESQFKNTAEQTPKSHAKITTQIIRIVQFVENMFLRVFVKNHFIWISVRAN